MDGFLSKPFKAAQLSETIGNVLRAHEGERSNQSSDERVDERRIGDLVRHIGHEGVEEVLGCLEAEVADLAASLRGAALRRDGDAFARANRSLWTSLSAAGFTAAAARCKAPSPALLSDERAAEQFADDVCGMVAAGLTGAREAIDAFRPSRDLH
jgi:HPt (histidine-containing phosphotransfer) domain-containing protein